MTGSRDVLILGLYRIMGVTRNQSIVDDIKGTNVFSSDFSGLPCLLDIMLNISDILLAPF